MKKRHAHAGFSLIELLVVVAIIAILIGGVLGIPWSNITRYARTSAIDQIESAAASARMTAVERGRTAAVIISQSETSDTAYVTVVVESDTPGIFYGVDGIAAALLPRGVTARAPAPTDTSANGSLYQTNTDIGFNINPTVPQYPDNMVTDATGTRRVKCFAVAYDSQGRQKATGVILWYDGNRDGVKVNGSNVQATDLVNVPLSPYVAIIDTRALAEGNALCFANGQASEDSFILGNRNNNVRLLTFNRYSGNALRK